MRRGLRSERRLLLLTPSQGLGGGIERVGEAIEGAWSGQLKRVDLFTNEAVMPKASGLRRQAEFSVRVARAVAHWRPSHVFCLHLGLLPPAAMASQLYRVPVSLMAQGTETWSPMPYWQRQLVARCARLIAISEFSAHWLSRRAGVGRERVDVLPLAINRRFAEQATRLTPITPAKTFITVARVAREHRYKGHHDIANALPAVLAQEPSARWVVVGTGDDLPSLEQRLEDLGVRRAVRLASAVSDERLAELYSVAVAHVLPSIADPEADPPIGEGFGLVYAEAGACGVPSIASAAGGGALDYVRDGETGLLVPPRDRLALVAAVLRVLREPELRDRLGRNAQTLTLARHLPEHFSERLHQLLA